MMKRLFVVLALLFSVPLIAQPASVHGPFGVAYRLVRYTGAPSAPNEADVYYNLTSHKAFVYDGTAFREVVLSGGAGGFPLLAPNGTGAAPSYSFANATGAGMFLNSATGGGVLGLATNGVEHLTLLANGELSLTGIAFASLGTPANGTIVYCSDCTAATPTAGGGSGAFVKRENGAWNASASSGVTGTGTLNTIPKVTNPTGPVIGDSAITDDGTNVKSSEAILPTTAAGKDFGSATLPWKDFWLAGSSGTPGTNNFRLTGTATAARVVTFPDLASYTLAQITNAQTFAGLQTFSSSIAVANAAQTTFGTATTADANADVLIGASATNKIPLEIQAKASPTVDWFRVTKSTNSATRGFHVQSDGGVIIDQDTGSTYTRMLDVQYQGTRMLDINNQGQASIKSGLTLLDAGAVFNWGSSQVFTYPSAGVFNIAGNSGGTAAAALTVIADANGSKISNTSSTELLSLSTSGTTTPTVGNLAVANSDIDAVVARVTTTITTATNWSVAVTTGIASCTNAWVAIGTTTTAQTSLTSGTTVIFKPAAGLQCHVGTASTLTVTTTGTPGAGVIRLTPIVKTYTAPTS